MKIDPSQVQRTEEVTAADGRKYQRKIVRLTPEQRAEYRRMVAEEERDLPRKIEYRVEAVFQEKEQDVLTAIDQYAAKRGLPNRGAVVRLALAKLLRIELAIPHRGCEAGRPRKAKPKRSSKAS